jgi:putative exosortase-associated protein (TIGR04073 family)
MSKFKRFFSFLLTGLLVVHMPMAQADMQQPGYSDQIGANRTYTPVNNATVDPFSQQSYTEKVGNKLLNAFANLTTSPLELPKNIINTMNQSNFFYGVFGGFLKGLVNTLGRTGCGVVDLITYPLPTRPIAYPVYIWDDFDVDTTYGPVFRLDTTPTIDQPAAQTPVTLPAPTPVATPPRAAVVNRSNQYNQNTNRKLDTVFKQEIQK